MKGWSSNEIENKELMALCGLYCRTCGVSIATRDNNANFRMLMAKLFDTKSEETKCTGCMQDDPPKNYFAYVINVK